MAGLRPDHAYLIMYIFCIRMPICDRPLAGCMGRPRGFLGTGGGGGGGEHAAFASISSRRCGQRGFYLCTAWLLNAAFVSKCQINEAGQPWHARPRTRSATMIKWRYSNKRILTHSHSHSRPDSPPGGGYSLQSIQMWSTQGGGWAYAT